MKLRIKFKKYGPVRFIGHLDLMRFFQKALRRAQIDVAYSEGFSPHQIMAFASPLGVGLVSNGEYMDIEIRSMERPCSMECPSFMECQEIQERLNAVSVPGIEITSVKILPDTAGNAMASVAAAAYTVRFREGREPNADIETLLPRFLEREQILITKKTKKGSKELDLKQGIFRLEYRKSSEDGSGEIFMIVDASSAGNIKPSLVVEALLAQNGETLQENALLITREEIYTNIGTEQQPRLAPLDEIGHTEDRLLKGNVS